MAWIMFWIKIGLSDKAKKVRNIRYKYRRQFMPTAAV